MVGRLISPALMRAVASRHASRAVLNRCVRALPPSQRERVHSRYARIFRAGGRMEPGDWPFRFAGKRVVIPFSGQDAWLEWDLALSALGHEVCILNFYETLLRSKSRPSLFVDVGANYGLHSLVFLVHGVRTLSFEPNVSCHPVFLSLCRRNGVAPELIPFALGDREASAELAFPERETWLGSVESERKEEMAADGPLIKRPVKQTTLDAFLGEDARPGVLKVDTEGNDLGVLTGARQTIERARPIVLFESRSGEGAPRGEFYDFFESLKYTVSHLRPDRQPKPVGREEFRSLPDINFAALPR